MFVKAFFLLFGKSSVVQVVSAPDFRSQGSRPQGYKTFFMLISAEHEISPSNKTKITNNCKFFLAKQG